ncbi:virulence factor Mce family protein [Nocardia amikacinitolerans]|uniref:MCE family protein n=1 Tax=Nocardia amikacinitolerans TaxID=756689 RepID=UPI000A036CAC|nr:MCE family protein [Nocardia amikacinitolerans]MCP2319996.1 virulence factor Mce family protein [Nocardia amikacinitolerans]
MSKRFPRLFGPVDRLLVRFGLPTLPEMWSAVPSYRQNRQWWLGVAAGVAVVALLVCSGLLTRVGIGEKTVHAEFAQAAGLRTGNSVDVSGVAVGTVRSARLAGDRILVSLSIDDDIELGPDASAAIEMSTILGKMHVELNPGTGSGLPGNRIPLARTSVPYNLAKVVDDPKYKHSFEHIERLDPANLRESLEAVNRQMGDSPQLTAQALDAVGVLAKVVSDRRAEVDSLLKNIDGVSRLVADNQNSVLLLLTRGQAIGDAVARRQQLVRQLLDDIAAASKALQDMGIENGGRLGPLIQSLNTMSEGLEKNRENLDRLYQVMPVALRQFNNSFGNGPYGEVYMPWVFPDNWLCLVHVVEGCR